jgi:hypothetical protein
LGGARLDSTANAFNRIEMGYTTLYCGGAGVLPENAVVQWYNDSSEDTRGALFLNGFKQTVSSISSPVRNATTLGFAIGSDTVRNETLTLKARESNTSCCKLRGGASLVYDPLDPSYVQTISNRIHTTSGGLVVKGGRLIFGGDTTTLAQAGYIRAEGGAFDPKAEWFLSRIRTAMERIIPYCRVIELNTSMITRRGAEFSYPCAELLAFWRQLGGEVIITTDCHDARWLESGYDEGVEILRRAGYDKMIVLGKDALLEKIDL